MFRLLILAMIQMFFASPGFSALLPTSCFGSKQARVKIIFLHGMAPKKAHKNQIGYEHLFAQIAKEKDVQVAIPYSHASCKKDKSKNCWELETQDGVSDAYQRILQSAKQCFGSIERFSLIGFSNGGYFAAKVLLRGLKPEPQWVVGIGSAGRIRQLKERASYPEFTLMIGKSDITRQEAKEFYQDLKNRKLPVEYMEFDGGHDLDKEAITSLLQSKDAKRI